MTRNIFLFLGTFIAGALIALVTRAALFNPHRGHEGHPAKAEYAPMVSNALTPTATPVAPAAKSAPSPAATPGAADPHAGHGAVKTESSTAPAKTTAATAAKPGQPVNTVCAICGMDVDPKLPTLEYKGQTVGFGCKMCAPKFKADPDRYGPAYLRNELIKK